MKERRPRHNPRRKSRFSFRFRQLPRQMVRQMKPAIIPANPSRFVSMRVWMAVWMGAAVLCLALMPIEEAPGGVPAGKSPAGGNLARQGGTGQGGTGQGGTGQGGTGQGGTGSLTGKVVAVSDGDTVTLLDGTRRTWRIRLAGIDAPEKGQPFGDKSRQSLAEMVFGRDVIAHCPEQDRFGRQVCTIRVGGQDINHEQIRRGMAWVFRRYANNPDYYRSEETARRERTGLWRDPQPIPPWEWRQTKTERNRQ